MTWEAWRNHSRFGLTRYRDVVLTIMVIGFVSTDVFADCVLRENAIGNYEYRCDSGKQGELKLDALGRWSDSESGTNFRETPLGNLEGSNGTTYRKDSLGRYRGTDGTVWRQDSLGNWKSHESQKN